jgi:RNA polymerase sigma-70 factor (ECF subfamily)
MFSWMKPEPGADVLCEGPIDFATTHWSLVLLAGKDQETQSAAALDKLCRVYWRPIYAFARRRGCPFHEAQDLVQEFFAAFLRRGGVERADPSKGRFRSFLLTSFSRFLTNEWQRGQRLKRGGGLEILSLEAQSEEERFLSEPVDELSPERVFAQRWAHLVLERVVSRLENEFAAAGRSERFECLKPFLSGDNVGNSYADTAAKLGTSVPAVTSIIHRTRDRYRELFREEIAQTVANPSEIDDEIRHLLAALT